jgi:nicotinate-nucleotide adenylyltransferase
MKRIAFYGGSFDPLHIGHLAIARRLLEVFDLDEFLFIPAFHAPHKKDKEITSAVCRYAMLALATNTDEKIKISAIELDAPERPYTFETQKKLLNYYNDSAEIFFVIGADSWNEITTWREWETVLTQTNIIVVTRPDYEIVFNHVTDEINKTIIDLRNNQPKIKNQKSKIKNQIFITDAIFIDVSASEIRQKIKDGESDWHELVPEEVAKYVKKYNLYI